MMNYIKPAGVRDLKKNNRIILAEGELTGHCHEVIADDAIDIPATDFFEEPSGRRMLLVMRPCVLVHQEHGLIALDPERPVQVRQGDVLLQPIGEGAWEVRKQREYVAAELSRFVAD